jgi:Na+-driven multidrug efflux pump
MKLDRKTIEIVQTAREAGLQFLSGNLTGFINMILLAYLGVLAITDVAVTTMTLLVFGVLDNAIRGVFNPLIGQCTSQKIANLPYGLQQVKQKTKFLLAYGFVDPSFRSTSILVTKQGTSKKLPYRLQKEKLRSNRKQQQGFVQKVLVQIIIVNSLFLSMPFGMLVGGLSIAYPQEIVEIFGAKLSTHDGIQYYQILGATFFLNSLSNTLSGTLQSLGQVKESKRVGYCEDLLHLGLGWIGVWTFGFGLKEMAWVTVFVQTGGISYRAYYLHKGVFTKKLISLRPNWQIQKDALRSAAPIMVDSLFTRVNVTINFHILASFGELVIASSRIMLQIISFPLALVFGCNVAVTNLVSKAYGNRDYKAVRQYTWTTAKIGFLLSSFILLLIFLSGEWITDLFFTDDPQVIEMTKNWMLVGLMVNVWSVTSVIIVLSLKAVQVNKTLMVISGVSNSLWLGALLLTMHYRFNLKVVILIEILHYFIHFVIVSWYFHSRKWEPSSSSK